jgi:hypothetical protein
MASKRRIRREACGNKRKYETEREALGAAMSAKKRGVAEGYLAPYRCGFCHKFHWGHKKPRL